MSGWQEISISVFGLTAFTLFTVGYYQCRYNKNAYGSFWPMNIVGAFVWGDTVVFGMFWTLVSVITLYLQDATLFFLFLSLFWLIRSFGEIIYWLNHQFASKNKNSIDNFPRLKKVFHNDSMWFVYQIYWQCVMVVAAVFTLYFGHLWLEQF